MWTIGWAEIKTPEGDRRIRQAEKHKCKRKVREEITAVAQQIGVIRKVTVRNYQRKPRWL